MSEKLEILSRSVAYDISSMQGPDLGHTKKPLSLGTVVDGVHYIVFAKDVYSEKVGDSSIPLITDAWKILNYNSESQMADIERTEFDEEIFANISKNIGEKLLELKVTGLVNGYYTSPDL